MVYLGRQKSLPVWLWEVPYSKTEKIHNSLSISLRELILIPKESTECQLSFGIWLYIATAYS